MDRAMERKKMSVGGRIVPLWARRAVVVAAGAAALSVACPMAQAAASYPDRPVTIIVPFTAGGFSDTVARLLAKGLGDKWGKSVIVDNRPGAGGDIAAAYAAKMPADGYTLFLANVATNAINPSIHKRLGFDVRKDFTPVALVVKTANVLLVPNKSPFKSVADLIAAAKAKPGTINFGTAGIGTSGHMAGELLDSMAGIKMVAVPYKGTPQGFTDLMNGNLQLEIDNIITLSPQVKAGRARALAVTSLDRSPLLPDVPTLNESGVKGFEATSWFGIAVPSGVPKAIVEQLNRDINSVSASPDFKSKVVGGEVVNETPEAFRQFQDKELDKWTRLAKEIHLQLD